MSDEQHVRVRYWAGARAAAGVAEDLLPVGGPTTVGAIRDLAVAAHPGADLARVLGVCSVLVGEQPAGKDPAAHPVAPGDTVEFLPPFAGG
ncbi:MoaD/ThiS family protein [Nocardioides sp.]|uniref:MoaD/ThiS family protein n=1 Tax=Nocardioides sp. TaxID=35761 RepID=UPI003518D995